MHGKPRTTASSTALIVATLHSAERLVLMSLCAVFCDGRLSVLKETYDPALLPIRWSFRRDEKTSEEADRFAAYRRPAFMVPTTGTPIPGAQDELSQDWRVISS
ncbi:hypothetical protein [Brevundimonas diminuta]|uniref:hypothetical protein n=1 Tax=Brevundimonas diminuta TaxID=293 RepID=UPI003D053BFF